MSEQWHSTVGHFVRPRICSLLRLLQWAVMAELVADARSTSLYGTTASGNAMVATTTIETDIFDVVPKPCIRE